MRKDRDFVGDPKKGTLRKAEYKEEEEGAGCKEEGNEKDEEDGREGMNDELGREADR